MADPGPVYEAMGKIAYEFSLLQPLIPTYVHLLLSAIIPIYAGAHASLSRPSSAADPIRASRSKKSGVQQDEEDEEGEDRDGDQDEDASIMEGLSPADAIWFPLLAGLTLAGLYFLIKWLDDPAVLNRILNWYFSLFGIFSVGKLLGDALNVSTSFVFPKRWRQGQYVWLVKTDKRTFVQSLDSPNATNPSGLLRYSPLPGWLSEIPCTPTTWAGLWTIRALMTEQWTFHARLHGHTLTKTKFGVNDVLGMTLGLIAVVIYNFVGKPWWLTNLMGFGFSYGALQLMSPTTFWTGTMILGSLFLYDIYFVFFTPLMVTVAKSLDIPIKLVFPRPSVPGEDPTKQALAMLGLGDVVLPGIMIGLALRFDLYLYYLRKQAKGSPTKAVRFATAAADGTMVDPHQETEVIKAPYHAASGNWGERFWTPSTRHHVEGGVFPKPYFYASLVGYVIGMIFTLGVMQIAGHAQPALLYLVPGVLGALWGTGLVRAELKQMWAYSESGDDEEPASAVEMSRETEHIEKLEGKADHKGLPGIENEGDTVRHQSPAKTREVFSLTITAPPPAISRPRMPKDTLSKMDEQTKNGQDVNGTASSPGKPAEKRQRRQ